MKNLLHCLVMLLMLGGANGQSQENALKELERVHSYGKPSRETKIVSIYSLLANPEKYHKKTVSVIALIKIGFEGDSLWVTREHLNEKVLTNAIFLNIDLKKLNISDEDIKKLNGKYVSVTGMFDAEDKGHQAVYASSFSEVYYISYREIRTQP